MKFLGRKSKEKEFFNLIKEKVQLLNYNIYPSRILIRKSGTEKVLRVMIESGNKIKIKNIALELTYLLKNLI